MSVCLLDPDQTPVEAGRLDQEGEVDVDVELGKGWVMFGREKEDEGD